MQLQRERIEKIAFIHIMRTGGTYTLAQFNQNDWDVFNSWQFFNRDWTKEESLQIASLEIKKNSVFHNHVASWDLETLKEFKKNGWLTFSIFRDPLDQLISLHSFSTVGSFYDFEKNPQIEQIGINEFIKNQLANNSCLNIECKHWEIPEWWKEIDIILDYEKDLFFSLKKTFNLNFNFKESKTNTFKKDNNVSQDILKILKSNKCQKRYEEFKKQNNNKLFVLITSCKNNEEYRSLARNGWLKDLEYPYLFVIGDEGHTRIENDVLYIHCGDSYNDCPIKQYLSINYINKNFEFDYLFCCDDDTYVIVNRLIESGFEKYDYFGGGPVHEQGYPHYVQGGAGIFLSKKAVEAIVNYPIDGEHLSCKWSDQMVGKIMHDSGIKAVYNKRFQMGHEEKTEWISRDYNRLISSHKLEPWKIKHAILDFNPFHLFDQIYCIRTDQTLYAKMKEQFEDANIEHLVLEIEGDYKEAVKDAIKNKHKKILILKDDDVFCFRVRDFARYLFEEIRDWEIICLGAEARRANLPTPSTFLSNEVTKFSGLGLDEKTFQSFIESKSVESWLLGKNVYYPRRACSTKNNEWYHGPEYVFESEISNPIKCALIVRCFRRGGAETEFNEMITRLNSNKIKWVGIACETAEQFDVNPNYKDKFPPIYVADKDTECAINLEGSTICSTFEEAVLKATKNADVVVKWHVNDPVVENLPHPSILLSNTFGRWVLETYKNVQANMYISNSIHSGKLFWNNIRARTIYSGHAKERLKFDLGRDRQRQMWGFQPEDKIVGYTGRIEMNKNIDTVIKAVSMLPSNYKLVLAGQPMENVYQEIEDMLNKYLPDRHYVNEWNHNVGDILSALDCFVLVSDYEGFSNSLAEAWMMDVPAVFSKCGAVMELEEKYGDIGVSVNIGIKPNHLSHKILQAISEGNKQVVKKIGRIMREDFSIEKSAEEWETAIIDCYNLFKTYDKLQLKIGLLVNSEQIEIWNSLLKYSWKISNQWYVFNSDKLEEEFENKLQFGMQVRNCDVLIVHDTKQIEKWLPKNYEKPIVLIASEGVEEYCHLASRFVSLDKKDICLFPKMIQRSVEVIDESKETQDWTPEGMTRYKKLTCLLQDVYKKKNCTSDLKDKIKQLVANTTPKRAARQLNMEEVPPPKNHQEWTYSNVIDFIAD